MNSVDETEISLILLVVWNVKITLLAIAMDLALKTPTRYKYRIC